MALPMTPERDHALDLINSFESGDIDLGDMIIHALKADGILFNGSDFPAVTVHVVAELMRR